MNKEIKEILQRIDQKKAHLDSLRPLPKELIQNLDEWFNIELAYNSNAIEGNTLSKSETQIVIEKGLTISGKSLKEHLEAINHSFALKFIQEISKEKNINLNDILQIHNLILKGIDHINSGIYRKIQVKISGSDVELPSPLKVPELMEEFSEWLNKSTEHPIIKAADAHYKLVKIHPFIDGNGRTARLLMNLILLQNGYSLTVIENSQRKEYIDAIQNADKGNIDDFYKLICSAVEKSLDTYLKSAQN